MKLPEGIDLDQYKTRARELLRGLHDTKPDAIARLRASHPEQASLAEKPKDARLSDAQLVVARECGFASWPKFREYLLFRGAVAALDRGDVHNLAARIDRHPAILRYRCRVGEPYESGYFSGATLLNHIAGNPGRCPLPSNIVEITRLLLSRGAGDDLPSLNYTFGLLLTSRPASEAGVAMDLIDLIVAKSGVPLDLTRTNLLTNTVSHDARATAEALLARGAHLDIRHAAALGRIELVQRLLDHDPSLASEKSVETLPGDPDAARAMIESAFLWACDHGQTRVADLLLDNGVDPAAGANIAQTGLHSAAHAGHLETVKRLIARGAPMEAINQYGATVLGQALWSATHEPRPEHRQIIEALIAAGAKQDVWPEMRLRIAEQLA